MAESVVKLTIRPFAALHRTVSASASFGNIILLLFIYWEFHVAGDQNRSLFFGVKRMPTSFAIFLLLPLLSILLLRLLLLPPTNHSIDTLRCYRTFNILLSANGWPKKTPNDQLTPRILLSRKQISAILSQLPQRRYRIITHIARCM